MQQSDAKRLAEIATTARQLTIESIYHAGTGHAGSSLSLVEILVSLYFRHLRFDVLKPDEPDRDRLILSKGHAAPVLYTVLALAGWYPVDWLKTLRQFGSPLQGHPKARVLPGIDVSTGSLGQGLSIGLGLASGFKRLQRDSRVYCILGDGELQEGQNWEAMMAAPALGADNLVAIVDRNGLQNDGETESIITLGDLVAKARAFGWHAMAIDGHDLGQIDAALTAARETPGRPTIVIAKTVKGKGISFMENVVKWHHHPISDDDYRQAMSELSATR